MATRMPSRGCVLVVEDEWIVAREIQDILLADGFDVPAPVASGEAALHATDTLHPDLVVMDIGLQGSADGIAVATTIASRHGIPIMFLSGASDPDTIERARAVGALAYLVKPIDARQLRTAVEFSLPRLQAEDDRGFDLTAETQSFRELFDAAADGVLVVDARGRIMLANQACARLFGYAADALVGQAIETLVPDAARARHRTARESFGTQPHLRPMGPELELSGRRADGSTFPIEVGLSPIGHDRRLRVIAVVRDATERRLAQRALQESRELAEQLHRVQRLDAVGRLAGGIAHDFNNLLMVICGYAEKLLDDIHEPQHHRPLLGIIETVSRAAGLTKQLLAFGRRQVLQPQIVDLNKALEAIEHMLMRVIGEDIRLVLRPANQLHLVNVDPGQMEQVLLNLVVNARDAMPEGGALSIETGNRFLPEPLELSGSPAFVPPGNYVALTVRDTGCGMDAVTITRAFEPFFSTKDPAKGTGLGLSSVYGIVKQSGGYIWIDSVVKHGTTVTIMLPASDERPAAPGYDPPAQVTLPSVYGRVLLVEDEDAVRQLLEEILTEAGYDVVSASDGDEGLLMLRTSAAPIDLIITDVVLPQTSGPAFIQSARIDHPDVRALFISGYTDGHLPLDYESAPNTRFLQKPFNRQQLLSTIADLSA
jgi:PAS domain S-box-containing protein